MAFEKITEEELASVGVENLPDRPALQPQEAKEKFEETAKKLLAPKINKLIEALIDATAAAAIGAAVPDALPEATEKNVQAVLQAVLSKLMEHERDTDNPHEVKADQVGAYTKQETDEALDAKMQDIGAGDMAKSVYDTKGIGRDIYIYSDEKDQELEKKGIFLYKATFLLDGWTGDGPYTQKVAVTQVDDGPAVTAASSMQSPVMIDDGFVDDVYDQMNEAGAIVNAGTKTLGDGTITCVTKGTDKPACDVEVFFLVKMGGEG